MTTSRRPSRNATGKRKKGNSKINRKMFLQSDPPNCHFWDGSSRTDPSNTARCTPPHILEPPFPRTWWSISSVISESQKSSLFSSVVSTFTIAPKGSGIAASFSANSKLKSLLQMSWRSWSRNLRDSVTLRLSRASTVGRIWKQSAKSTWN